MSSSVQQLQWLLVCLSETGNYMLLREFLFELLRTRELSNLELWYRYFNIKMWLKDRYIHKIRLSRCTALLCSSVYVSGTISLELVDCYYDFNQPAVSRYWIAWFNVTAFVLCRFWKVLKQFQADVISFCMFSINIWIQTVANTYICSIFRLVPVIKSYCQRSFCCYNADIWVAGTVCLLCQHFSFQVIVYCHLLLL